MQIKNTSFYQFANSDLWNTKTQSNQNAKELSSTQESQEDSTKETTEEKRNTQMVNGKELEPDEVQYVRELERIDRNVKAHEAAHIAAGGGVVSGGASYGYTRGPDGKMYAVSGEVPISMKKGKTPEETIQNARQIVAAAMAPADPSPQDYKVAASAMQMESQARVEQSQEKIQENEENLKEEEQKRQEQEQEKPFFEVSKRQYALQIYTQNQTSYQPKIEIAG